MRWDIAKLQGDEDGCDRGNVPELMMKEKWHQIVMKAELFVIVMVKTQSSNIAKHRRNDDGCVPEIDFMRIMTSRTMLVIMTMMIETKKKTK